MDESDADRPMIDMPRRERRLLLLVVLAALLAVAALIALFWRPAPPRVVLMSSGAADGAYQAYALRYQQLLAREGIRLVLEPSTGAVQNLQRLRSGDVGLALLQGGVGQAGPDDSLRSLGSMFLEPLWVFHRKALTVDRLAALAGRRVAVGPPGSGTRQLAMQLLQAVLPNGAAIVPVDRWGESAASALQHGQVDAALFVASPDAPAVRQLLRDADIEVLDFKRAEAYSRRFPFLTPVDLPAGAIDLAANIPARDVHLIAATASLVARDDTHPVLVGRVLAAAHEVHGGGSALWRAGRFPSAEAPDFPLSQDAARFYKNGPSVWQRYLPFWAVAWLQRLLFLGLPIIAIGVPLLRYMPALYRWGMRRRIYRWYGELAFIERAVLHNDGERELRRRQLDGIEARINGLQVPRAYASEAYMLKMHLRMVRDQLQREGSAAPRGQEQGKS